MGPHYACKSHCCLEHGCKYGHSDCPVTTGLVKQDYPCELCDPQEKWDRILARAEHDARVARAKLIEDAKGELMSETEYEICNTVDHPDYYGGEDNTYEAIKIIEAYNLNFSLGNAIKYILRAGKKNSNTVEDLEKAKWYVQRQIEFLEGKNE